MVKNQSRREFLRNTAVGGAAAASSTANSQENAGAGRESLLRHEYPVFPVASAAQLKDASATVFHYPDRSSPCVLIKTGSAVPGGVGPQRDIVAFSAMCTHMGCHVAYDPANQTLKCPCHFSVFDPENGGQMVCGQATEPLPQIELRFDERSGRVNAVGVLGQLYGRVSNVL